MTFVLGAPTNTSPQFLVQPKHFATHMQVLGASGVGKSFFLEHLLRHKIAKGYGVCLIDPHGEVYDNLVAWLAASGYRAPQVHLIDPSRSDFSVGFNPLALDREPTRCVSDMINAIVRVWGGDVDETPRLKKCLRLTLYALAYHRLSLLEANIFTSTRHKQLRQRLTAQLPLQAYRDEWAEFDTYSDKEFREYFESTRSRLFEFVTAPAIRPIIGQTSKVLNFAEVMEKQHVVLVNLSEGGNFSKQDAQLLGAMITAELYSAAKQRDVVWAKNKPMYAVIDECGSFINEDISNSLDETRKYGLHFVLSHQRLQQLKNVSDDCYDAVMANAQAKVIFRVNEDDNAEVLARQLFRHQFDLEQPKEIMNKPVATGQEVIELFGHASAKTWSASHTDSESSAEGTSSGEISSSGVSTFIPETGDSSGNTFISGDGISSGSSSMSGSSSSFSQGYSESEIESSSQSLRTVYEVMPTATYSLEELVHLGNVSIRDLPSRTAYAVLPGEKPVRFTTADVKPALPLSGQTDWTIKQLCADSRYTKSQTAIEAELAANAQRMFGDDGDGWYEDDEEPKYD
ncbi:type IV secretion system DNA-binding domain-containing protein [uncultured Tateyamaria sp.]|uniref:type IV secretory system conjugative DNA transfer family protein n=1 Tax=uncultured Tateyamaria sp. TaxID=455651 RepID=UPI002617CA49|nr:type IV secretion system DNA-binding domain-containing protein [uncultured Tateyamaria sp.]